MISSPFEGRVNNADQNYNMNTKHKELYPSFKTTVVFMKQCLSRRHACTMMDLFIELHRGVIVYCVHQQVLLSCSLSLATTLEKKNVYECIIQCLHTATSLRDAILTKYEIVDSAN